MDPELVKLLIGGGSAGGLIYAVIEFMRSRHKTRRLDEETAISRLHADLQRKESEAAKAWRIVQWYRDNYPRLWAAYVRLPPEDKELYPPTPPPDIDN